MCSFRGGKGVDDEVEGCYGLKSRDADGCNASATFGGGTVGQ